MEHKIFVTRCNWDDKTAVSNWTPLYQPLPGDDSVKYDAYGRNFGESYFQFPREPQKQHINDDVRYYCFEDCGDKTLVYKETGFVS